MSSLIVVALSLVAAAASVSAEVYKVGDSAGWTTLGHKDWSAAKTFQLGDIILFEYNAQLHNVMQVTHLEYRACNTTFPKATHTTGNDSITLTRRGHHYYFCGVPGHCQAGQKVDINVPRLAVGAPSPSNLVSPTAPASPEHLPSANNRNAAAALGSAIIRRWLSTMVILVTFCSHILV